jgi:hypothetical protein
LKKETEMIDVNKEINIIKSKMQKLNLKIEIVFNENLVDDITIR